MSTVTIPNWTADGLLPPVDLASPTSDVRSPYRVALTDFVLRFATTPERIAIIDGLLRYRSEIHAVGLARGFQWVNGSFLENVEVIRSQPPKDVDLVTFYQLPTGETQASIVARNAALFDHDQVKVAYTVDAYTLDLGLPADDIVQWSAYWYGVWSHQRTTLVWKGFVEVDLDSARDADARAILASVTTTGGAP